MKSTAQGTQSIIITYYSDRYHYTMFTSRTMCRILKSHIPEIDVTLYFKYTWFKSVSLGLGESGWLKIHYNICITILYACFSAIHLIPTITLYQKGQSPYPYFTDRKTELRREYTINKEEKKSGEEDTYMTLD